MCMCSNNSMNHAGTMAACGASCFSLGPFRAVRPECTAVPNTGTIIPFSSGVTPVVLTTVAAGLISLPSLIGFGTAIPSTAGILGGILDLTGLLNEAFQVPRAGSITAISASFTTTVALDLLAGSATITAQVYRAPAGSSVFTATNAAVNLLPAITGPLAVGTVSSASADVAPIPVAPGDRLLMVYTVTASEGLPLATVITGSASAGITIS